MSRTRSQTRLAHHTYRNKELQQQSQSAIGLKAGKAGFSEEYLDKLQDSDHTTTSGGGRGSLDNGDASSLADLSGWEKLRLSDGDLLRSSSASHRDVVDYEKQLKVQYDCFCCIIYKNPLFRIKQLTLHLLDSMYRDRVGQILASVAMKRQRRRWRRQKCSLRRTGTLRQ